MTNIDNSFNELASSAEDLRNTLHLIHDYAEKRLAEIEAYENKKERVNRILKERNVNKENN